MSRSSAAPRPALQWRTGIPVQALERSLPRETAVGLSFDGRPHTVLMATPQDVEDLALGFVITEGVADAEGVAGAVGVALAGGVAAVPVDTVPVVAVPVASPPSSSTTGEVAVFNVTTVVSAVFGNEEVTDSADALVRAVVAPGTPDGCAFNASAMVC